MVTVADALPPFRLAVTVACPSALDATGKSAKSAPAQKSYTDPISLIPYFSRQCQRFFPGETTSEGPLSS